jgi:predicted MFS family arabinose efflux permease
MQPTNRLGRARGSSRWVRGKGWVFAALAVAFFLAFLSRYATAVIVPEMEEDFGIDAAGIGLLGAAYFWAYALMQPPAGLLADSIGPRRAITALLTVGAAATLMFALATSLPWALAARAAAGFGTGIVYVCALRVFSRWFRPDQFGPVTGAFGAVGNAGGLIAAGPLAAVIAALGWRTSFAVMAGLMVIATVSVWVVVRDAPAASHHRDDASGGVLRGAGTVLRHRNTWLLGSYAFVTLGILAAMQGLWTVPYLRDVHGLSKQAASNVLTLWGAGLIVGLPFWGYLADRVVRRRRAVLLVSVALHLPVWALLAWRPADLPVGLVGGLFLWSGFVDGCWTPAYAQLKDSLPAAVSGTAIGLLNFAFFAGAAAFQQITGAVLDVAGGSPAHGYRLMFGLFAGALVVAALCLSLSRDAPPGGST